MLSIRSLALSAAAALAPAAQAQNLQLYGLIDMAGGRFQASGSPAVWAAENGGMSNSFLGVKGSDDLGGGIRAKFAIEHYLRPDTGNVGRFDGDAFWARNAYVGLSGAFGTSVLGRNTTPLYVSALLFNAFGDSSAFSPTMRLVFSPRLLPFFGDSRWNNSIAYSSPDEDGLSYSLMANLGEGPSARGKNLSAGLMYEKGPLAATVVWQRVKNGAGIAPLASALIPPGFGHQDTWQLGASYDLGVAKLYGQYTKVRTRATEHASTRVWSLGAAVPIGAGEFLAQYGSALANMDGTQPRDNILSLGYDYNLSKLTDIYAVYMKEKITAQSAGNTVAGGIRLRW